MLDSQSSHVFMVGQAGDDLARARGLDVVDNEYFTTPKRRDFWLSKKKPQQQQQQKVDEHGTVGAVALDLHGNLAAANSTGGMMFKHTGRMGDTAIVGAGLYADKDVSIAW
jgi:beta-aspartyl-peptidase (threonine type)